MLSALLAHIGRPPEPHDLWGAWNLHPLVVAGLASLAWLHHRGRRGRLARPGDTLRGWCFTTALVVLAVALVSPLDALSNALASAHMVQHVLLVLVAAPLLAISRPGAALWRGTPPDVRHGARRWRARLSLTHDKLGWFRLPATAWLAHVAVLWFWHASGPYDAALASELVHIVEHGTFLATGVLFWGVVAGGRAAGRVSNGLGVLLVFGMALQSVFLSALLVFARSSWYSSYATTTVPWGLDPLADQQLAGAIMWIPAGAVYVAAGLALFIAWVRSTEDAAEATPGVPLRQGL